MNGYEDFSKARKELHLHTKFEMHKKVCPGVLFLFLFVTLLIVLH